MAVAALGAIALAVMAAGVAGAVSTGGYNPSQQDCAPNADANTTLGAQPGCHNAKVNVSNSSGQRFVQAGTDQQAQGDNTHAADVSVTPNGRTPGQSYSGPAIGAHIDTNYQPIPANQCGLEDIALYAAEEAAYKAGQGPPSCTLDPTKWNAPSGAPTVQPQTQTGTPDGSATSLLTGGQVYFGADDNLDSGEHDGANGQYGTAKSINGPSDGGSFVVNWQPGQATTWMADLQALMGGNPTPLAQNPVPVANAGGGGCADGTCFGVYTAQTPIYHGGSGGSRDAYNYQGKTWDPYDCSSGSPQNEQACQTEGGHNMDWYRQQEAKTVYAEPGAQVYEDPDPQASPAGPTQAYPLPSAYAGTCGVAAGGGAAKAPSSPVTNSAGQVVVSPTHC